MVEYNKCVSEQGSAVVPQVGVGVGGEGGEEERGFR